MLVRDQTVQTLSKHHQSDLRYAPFLDFAGPHEAHTVYDNVYQCHTHITTVRYRNKKDHVCQML